MTNRCRTSIACISLAGLLALPAVAQQQPDWASIEVNTVKLTDGVYMLTGRGGNIGLSIGKDGAFVIDDQFAPLTEKILAAIASLTPEPVRFVLNTHWHFDHTGGNENLGKAGALIVAHDNVRKRMNPEAFKDLVGNSNQAPPDALPIITFSDEVNFHWNGDRIHVVHVAHSHTDGDGIVFFTEQNVVHMGDTFFNGFYPFIDVNSGGSVQGVIASSSLVLGMIHPDTKIIPGHGPLASAVELRAYRDMLEAARDAIAPMVARGMSEDDVVAAKPTAALDETWGTNSERFVRGVYRSLLQRGH